MLLHDFAPRTEFIAGGLTEADLDLQVLDITVLLLHRLAEAGYASVGLPEPAPASG